MSTASLNGLLIISVIAVIAPVLAASVKRLIILGAFLAGVILNLVDPDTASHPVFRSKLDALGYGFVIPVFFVSSGVEYDLSALTRSPSALARIPLFLLSLLIVRGAPAALYARAAGRRGAVAAGLLQATSLPVIVTAASIGVAIHAIAPVTASALVAAGLLSVAPYAAQCASRGPSFIISSSPGHRSGSHTGRPARHRLAPRTGHPGRASAGTTGIWLASRDQLAL